VFALICCWSSILLAQQTDSLNFKNGLDRPNILSTHHFGIFSSRINQNFKIGPPKATDIIINYTSGNNFHPFVEAYFPKDPDVREALSKIVWHDRPFKFIDQETTPADYMNIVIDAVIKGFRFDISFPLAKHHELNVSLRSYLITKGIYPFSILTSDKIIEWFHSNIAGGEDPYGRSYYGLEQVNFKYADRNGNILELHNNDFFFGGIELSHFYYPSFLINEKRKIFFNFGTHLGINTSKYNPSLDFGVSADAIKTLPLKNNNEFNFAVGISLLKKNVINFDAIMDLGNNPFLATVEGQVEYARYTKKNNYHSFGINYQIQTPYNKVEEADYYKLLGKWKEINAGWHYGVTTLYKYLSNWTLIYTYGSPNYKLSLFIKEDLVVNNAPDIQTGISFQLPLLK